MLATRLFLGFSVLVWLPYGLFCVFQPGYLDEAAGLLARSPTGTTEIRAMYGGLQAAIGAFCLTALLRPTLRPTALLFVCYLTGGLFIARLLGLAMDGGGSGYTYGALGFELLSTLLAGVLSRREPEAAPA
jgi:hypothetical protein